MTSTLKITHAHCYLIAIVFLAVTMTVAHAEDPADETVTAVMKTPMPAGHEMPGAAIIDPMPAASMDPAQPGKRMGSMAKMKAKEKIPKMSAAASVTSTLPGFAGASHLYHVGATGFFLNLSPRITLTADQQSALNQIKFKALLSKSASDRQIEAGEQELWLLTAVDSPSAVKITAKVREIEKERGDERIAFIQAVGEAAKMLTPAQQAQLFDEFVVLPANDSQRDDVLQKAQVQGAPQMTAGCSCMEMMSGEMSGLGQRGMTQTDQQSGMNMPGMEGMVQRGMPKGMASRSTGGAMAGMNGGGATGSAGGAASGCCAMPQQQAAARNQSGGQTLLAGAEEQFRINPLLRPAQNTPRASTTSSSGASTNDLEKWSGPELGLFTLQSLSSSEVALSDYRGKPLIVHFFATWCGPCREEMAGLRRFVSRVKNKDLSVLAVSIGEPDDRVRRFFDLVPVNFPILLDRSITIAHAWRVATLPTTYVLSPELKPKLILRGAQLWDQLDVGQIVKKLDEANQEPSQRVGRLLRARKK